MALSVVFTGCASEEEEGADVAKDTGAKTITMHIISEKEVCNSDAELEVYLKEECGGDKESAKYKEMLATMAAYDAVEAEFTKLTKSQHKTNVDIIFYTEDEYKELIGTAMDEYALEQKNSEVAGRALEKYIEEYQSVYPEYPLSALEKSFYKYFPEYERYKDFISQTEDEEVEDEQYKENDLGIKELVFPEAEENQLDIILINGFDMYTEYIENEWITSLNSYISTTGKQLTYNISTSLLNGVKYDGETYAIPNNVQMGEYTYMLVDKELAEKYKYTWESFEDLIDCRYFVEDLVETEPNTLPIDATFQQCMDLFVWYWNIGVELDELGSATYTIDDSNKFSVIGKVYGDPAKAGRGKIDLGFTSLFADEAYREIYLCLKEYEMNGSYKTAGDTREGAAISFVNGTYAIKKDAFFNADGTEKKTNDPDYGVYTDENGKEYYLYVAKYPEADEEALYGNMFAVSANSKHTEACVKVLTMLNTNPELRNILQYGIEGENYTIDETTGVLERLNNDYMMDIRRTGNCFIAHPEEGLPADYWEDAKAQNNDALINPLLGFDFNARLAEYGQRLDNSLLDLVNQLTEEKVAELDACGTYDELEGLVNGTLAETMKDNPTLVATKVPVNLAKITNKAYNTSTGNGGEIDEGGESPYTIYYNWLTAFGYAPAN